MAALLATTLVASSLVIVLSAVVLLARRWLMPGGHAEVEINGQQCIEAARGERLLWALAENGVLLPAACGGRGSCGQCRITVLEGGGPPLPVETALISRRQAAAGDRLACMVTIRQDLRIRLPVSMLEARRLLAVVERTQSITTFLKEITLRVPADAAFSFEAGDYVLVEAPAGENRFADFDIGEAYRETWEQHDLLRLRVARREQAVRAYSIASAPSADALLQLVVRIALPPPGAAPRTPPGQASSWLFGLRPGERVPLSGPFGEFHVRDDDAEMVFIGGGAGIAPLRSMIIDQLRNHGSRRRMSLWYGAREVSEICYRDEFDALAGQYENFSWRVALSDPRPGSDWAGSRGFIHAVLRDAFIAEHEAPEELQYYLCGPPLMSSAVVAMLEDYGVPPDRVLYDDFGS